MDWNLASKNKEDNCMRYKIEKLDATARIYDTGINRVIYYCPVENANSLNGLVAILNEMDRRLEIQKKALIASIGYELKGTERLY